ncbi:uncharacterized membrane-anchored protein YitT (DUF2179 family) [Salsuginibacillus halophilus]|uniref:Uncharacterized membrane-anchored protein YitT (DUF2179 family) n=1 Tax=Salsuginibacillus halophilus TaxID=517424 RepID=A0A2P8H9W7_9BACI|nr:YitT family protein [Salsuginibacillus halophilus]PSL42980.1 uncharacterized membrane-anchored protein YitT (DUF2179 family) [Salsuginibacillus halophilus]
MKNIIYIIIGTFIFAAGTTQFAMPNSIADGGIVGVSLLIYYSTGLSPGLSTPLIFIVLLAIGARYLPRVIIYKTVFTISVLSFFLWALEDVLARPIDDVMLAAVFFGIFAGAGFGFIFQAGSSVGGSSIIARIMNHQLGWSLTGTNLVVDAIIVLAGIFVIGPILAMYTLIALYIGKVVTDFVLGGFDSKKALNVVSPYSEEISHRITHELASSATVFYGQGEYMKEQRRVLYIVIHSHKLLRLKRVIKEVDPDAFIVVHNVKDVSGGFISSGFGNG